MSSGPSVVGAAIANGTSVTFGGGGAMASTNSLGGAGGVTLPSARCFGAAVRCFVLVSSALVRFPGERSDIIAMKLFAVSMPGKFDSTPR
jgi:hypothetical protein